MQLAKTHAISLLGLVGTAVEVEVDISAQLPAFVLVGLPDASLNEATARVRAACGNSGFAFPSQKVLVNLSPAAVPKSGSAFDLAIAVGVIAAMAKVSQHSLSEMCFIGELGLDGALRPVSGVLPMVLAARAAGFKKVVVPHQNLSEARLVSDLEAIAFTNLRNLIAHMNGAPTDEHHSSEVLEVQTSSANLDLADVVGQSEAVEGLIVAAAGGHHMSMIGSPGAGKTMLAERLPTILPELSIEEALEVAAIESVAGRTGVSGPLSLKPRFHAPHHGASMAAIIGGGVGVPRPGAVSLAHHGVLFLDEAPEFNSNVLESLRQTLESGTASIHRAGGIAIYPANFQLIIAANPCPCGFFGSISKECVCTYLNRRRYAAKLSGPLRDRIDIRLDVKPVRNLGANLAGGELSGHQTNSATALSRVAAARLVAKERLSEFGLSCNAQVPGALLKSRLSPGPKVLSLLDRQLATGKTSMRGYYRCLKVAWTIADLAGANVPDIEHVAQAISLRGPDQMIGVA